MITAICWGLFGAIIGVWLVRHSNTIREIDDDVEDIEHREVDIFQRITALENAVFYGKKEEPHVRH